MHFVEGLQAIENGENAGRIWWSARVDPNHRYLRDHFPGFPVVPAFVEIEWIFALIRTAFGVPIEITVGKFIGRLTGGESIRIEAGRRKASPTVGTDQIDCTVYVLGESEPRTEKAVISASIIVDTKGKSA